MKPALELAHEFVAAQTSRQGRQRGNRQRGVGPFEHKQARTHQRHRPARSAQFGEIHRRDCPTAARAAEGTRVDRAGCGGVRCLREVRLVDATRFLDEFRPFRRGELTLARRRSATPAFLDRPEFDLLRYALRLAQLSALARGASTWSGRWSPTDCGSCSCWRRSCRATKAHLQARDLAEQIPALAKLVGEARAVLLGADRIDSSMRSTPRSPTSAWS